MARKGRERFEKRLREQARREKAQAKATRKQERAEEDTEVDDEAALYERFRLLSERHDAGEIDDDDFAEQRREIFELLGLDAG